MRLPHMSFLCLKGGPNNFTAVVTQSPCVWLYQTVITYIIQLCFQYIGRKLTLIFNLSCSASLKLYSGRSYVLCLKQHIPCYITFTTMETFHHEHFHSCSLRPHVHVTIFVCISNILVVFAPSIYSKMQVMI